MTKNATPDFFIIMKQIALFCVITNKNKEKEMKKGWK